MITEIERTAEPCLGHLPSVAFNVDEQNDASTLHKICSVTEENKHNQFVLWMYNILMAECLKTHFYKNQLRINHSTESNCSGPKWLSVVTIAIFHLIICLKIHNLEIYNN